MMSSESPPPEDFHSNEPGIFSSNETEDHTNYDQEICRVCRSEGTIEQPLFYPCQCSGSIKYIHQDCLIEWLKHSRKKYCELCKYPFTFSPVYVDQMPHKIPLLVLVGGLVKQLVRCLRTGLSFAFAGLLWVVAVPILTSQIFRYYFGSNSNLQGFFELDIGGKAASNEEAMLELTLFLVFEVLQGFLVTAFTVFLVLGMMLFNEFISNFRHTTTTPIVTPTNIRNNTEIRTEIAPQAPHNTEIRTEIAHQAPLNTEIRTEIAPQAPHNTEIRTEIAHQAPLNTEIRTEIAPQAPRNIETRAEIAPQAPRNIETTMQESPLTTEISTTQFPREQAITSPRRMSSSFAPPTSPLRRHSDHRNLTSPGISHSTNNYWAELAHPKEYRNYVRRSELQRGTMESDPLMQNDFDGDHISNISGTSTIRSRFTTTTSASRSSDPESFRCRICFSATCISREHVIQASEIRNTRTAQRNQSLLQRNSLANNSISENEPVENNETTPLTPTPTPTTTTPTTTNTTTPNQDGGGGNLFGNWNLDAAESISLPEFFGFTQQGTHVLELLQNALIVVGCNAIVMYVFFCLPYAVGSVFSNAAILSRALAFTNNLLSKYSTIQLKTFSLSPTISVMVNVILGYTALTSICSLYGKVARGRRNYFNRAFLPATDFLGNFLKVLTLFFVEVAVFPLICGSMLSFMTLPLFPENTIQMRMEWLNKMPISGLAVLWALGGFFMVSFASSISFMRSFMRPGLLFFLRNPLDPDNHPVREMVERSFFDQIYRIAISVIFYAILIGSSFGVFVQLAKFAIFPLHLKFTNPLIEVPVDLLLHLVLRSLSQSCSPIKYTKALAILACKRVCRHLRLSSYFIGGGRYLAEETGPKDGSFVAVPDFDRLYKRERLREIRSQTISPLDVSKLKIVSDRHNTPVMDTSTTTPPPSYHNKDWAVVFRPNSFKLRCAAFLLCAIFAVQVYLFGIFVAPLLTGRLCVSWTQKTLLGASQTRVHDIYTWALGSAIFLLTFKLLQILLEPREKNPSSANQTRVSFNFVKTLHLALKAVIVSFFIGFVWPVLAGLLFTLIINPIIYQQYASSATMTNNTSEFFSMFFQNQKSQQITSIVAVFFSACWSLGFPILRLIYAMRRHFPFITQSTLQFLQDWRDNLTFERLSVRRFLQSLALPFTCSLLLCLLLPPTICTLVVPLFSSHESVMEAQHSSHLLALLAFILLKGFKASIGLCKMAISTIRDDNYLIGRRLHNLETRR